MSKCLECGYYDKEKHYCPFYCQLIRETLNEAISFELEKIKAEIAVIPTQICLVSQDKTARAYRQRSLAEYEKDLFELIDNHISELKGENNG